MSVPKRNHVVNILQEFSIPLLAGAVVAMLGANFAGAWYQDALHWMPFGHVSLFGHDVTLHFLVNDLFMVFFFGIAAKEITEACLPGGSLNPVAKALVEAPAWLGGADGYGHRARVAGGAGGFRQGTPRRRLPAAAGGGG
jgi:NhaA family Na+:H+ antiporter